MNLPQNRPNVQLEMSSAGLRPSTDSRVLIESVQIQEGGRIAELGSGIGNVTLELAARHRGEFHGFEVQEILHQTAIRNRDANQERLNGTVDFHLMDIRRLPSQPEWCEYFDNVIMNPPWYPAGTGRLSPDPVRAAATHELRADLADFLTAAEAILKPGGQCRLILIVQREKELQGRLKDTAFTTQSIQPISTLEGRPAKWILVELQKKISSNNTAP